MIRFSEEIDLYLGRGESVSEVRAAFHRSLGICKPLVDRLDLENFSYVPWVIGGDNARYEGQWGEYFRCLVTNLSLGPSFKQILENLFIGLRAELGERIKEKVRHKDVRGWVLSQLSGHILKTLLNEAEFFPGEGNRLGDQAT